ncbi:AMP-binding protein [Novosphingobium cyanobacteriorum]|uniref:AMP-binding protein n=1 Tax=Novosphingobium cyanobacteriorum TaxID=3024215 RepID=UPI0023F67E41|nr:AMP-binding protein [Novosphingobium cyanobacteriorum]
MDDGIQTITAGAILALHDQIPRGLRSASRVAVAPANAAELVRALILLDKKVSAVLLLPVNLDPLRRLDLAQSEGATVIDDLEDVEVWEKPLWPPLTRWSLVTSGTSGDPKAFDHTFASLLGKSVLPSSAASKPVWGLLYDPCRFAGLQVLLHAVAGGGRLIAPPAEQDLATRLRLLWRGGCTHLSATPSLWRRILMHPGIGEMNLLQITLGGEAADQPLLDRLKRTFPRARVSHTYASTEVGVGFSVHDGLAGFPASWLDGGKPEVDLTVREGLLWIRPAGAPVPGTGRGALIDAAGFICTQDRVRLDGERVVFLGRDGSVVNIGGAKVHPELVEDTIRRHPSVRDCAVRPRPSPVLGFILAAEVIADSESDGEDKSLALEIKRWCRDHLPREARPALVTIVKEITLSDAGKLQRTNGA